MSDMRDRFVAAAKKRWANPEYREKVRRAVSTALKASWARRKAQAKMMAESCKHEPKHASFLDCLLADKR